MCGFCVFFLFVLFLDSVLFLVVTALLFLLFFFFACPCLSLLSPSLTHPTRTQVYRGLFSEIGGVNNEKSLEDSFFEREVHLNRLAFESQFGYGCFFAYFKLKEQEVRNIVWIAECIQQDQKAKINQYIPIF